MLPGMDPAINAPTTDEPELPADEPPPTDVTELAGDVAGAPLQPDEPPTIKPPFEPPFAPSDVDQTVRHGGAPGVRVKHMGFLTEPVRASSVPQLGGRVVPDEILAEARRLLVEDETMELSEFRNAVFELLAPWLPPPPA